MSRAVRDKLWGDMLSKCNQDVGDVLKRHWDLGITIAEDDTEAQSLCAYQALVAAQAMLAASASALEVVLRLKKVTLWEAARVVCMIEERSAKGARGDIDLGKIMTTVRKGRTGAK